MAQVVISAGQTWQTTWREAPCKHVSATAALSVNVRAVAAPVRQVTSAAVTAAAEAQSREAEELARSAAFPSLPLAGRPPAGAPAASRHHNAVVCVVLGCIPCLHCALPEVARMHADACTLRCEAPCLGRAPATLDEGTRA